MASAPPLSLQWLVHVRDHENLTVYEFALGSLYATCGEGKRIFLSDKGAADILSIKRHTVATARKGLLAKGLVEDIGQHGAQPQQREYRLAVPVRGDGPQTATPCTPNGHPDGPQTATGVVPKRAQHQEGYQEEDQDDINITGQDQLHGDDGCHPSSQSRSKAAPAGPRPAGADALWTDWDDPDDGGVIAKWLGVPVESIGQPFRAWLDGFLNSVDFDHANDRQAVKDAALKAAGKPSQVGYFKTILPGYVTRYRAEREQAEAQRRSAREQEAEDQAAKERAERELWESTEPIRNKILTTITGDVPVRVWSFEGYRVQSWYEPGCVPVWHHAEFDAGFAGSHNEGKCPGADWTPGYLRKSRWAEIKDRGIIPLRRDS